MAIYMTCYVFLVTFLILFVHSMSQPSLQGEWHLLHESVGISAMHTQLLHNNKVVMFDRTDFGPSNVSLPDGHCRHDPHDSALRVDCTAHSILYDVPTNTFRPLMVQTDTWCSSGAIVPNGTLIQTGGYNDGDHVMRTFTPCQDDSCDWVEFGYYLLERRWYASNQILPDGRIIIVGGRRQFNYEFYPRSSSTQFHFLAETTDGGNENNLYPFLHLLPDGNLFIFANTRSILFDYKNNRLVREFPGIPGDDPRNYPSSGSSVMLPLHEDRATNTSQIEVEILVCGGAPKGSFARARRGTFIYATSTCGRLTVTDPNPSWNMESMPIARVMGDMLILPTGDVIIINGAERGTAGWDYGRDPVTRPVIYRPLEYSDWQFSVMATSMRPRMYHSTAILLHDGRVLVGGHNPHVRYDFSDVMYPTDLSLEAFSPPYLALEYAMVRPEILSISRTLNYGHIFTVKFRVNQYLTQSVVSIRIIAPSFTTHSNSMNQRMVVLKMLRIISHLPDTFILTAVGPSTAEIAPPGYYMLFVVHAGTPSCGEWVRVG